MDKDLILLVTVKLAITWGAPDLFDKLGIHALVKCSCSPVQFRNNVDTPCACTPGARTGTEDLKEADVENSIETQETHIKQDFTWISSTSHCQMVSH